MGAVNLRAHEAPFLSLYKKPRFGYEIFLMKKDKLALKYWPDAIRSYHERAACLKEHYCILCAIELNINAPKCHNWCSGTNRNVLSHRLVKYRVVGLLGITV